MSERLKSIPAGWRWGTIGELAEGVRGVSYHPEQLRARNDTAVTQLLRSTNIQGNKLVHEDSQYVPDAIVKEKQKAKPGDLALCMSNGSKALVGKSAVIGSEALDSAMTVGAFCSIFKPKTGSVPSFVRQAFLSQIFQEQIDVTLAGSAINNLKNSDIENFYFPIPPASEQRGIAAVLSALDEQIEATEALITKLELTRSGLYAGLRDTHPPIIQIGDHFNLISGMTPLRSTTHFYGSEGVPWVKTLDLNESRLFETDEKVTARALAACSLRVMPAGTVLLAMYGGWIQIGRTALLETAACTNQAITALSPKCPADWNPYFVMKVLQAWRHKWRDFAVSTRKDPNITKSDISQFMLPMPGIVEQTHWAESLESADELIDMHKAEAAKLRLQKQGLMRDLLTGKVRVH